MKNIKRVMCGVCLVLLVLTLSAPLSAHAGDTRLTVTPDIWERELYKDDTAITLTVTTPDNCASITVSQLGSNMSYVGDWYVYGAEGMYANIASDPFYYAEVKTTLTYTAADTATRTADGVTEWVVTADFGMDGVYGIEVTAYLTSGENIVQRTPVYVRYPTINIVDLGTCAAWEAYILRDSDEPFCFVLDLSETDMPYKEDPDIDRWDRYVMYNGYEATRCSKILLESGYRNFLFGEADIDPWAAKFASDSPVYGEMVLWNSIPFDLRMFCRGFAGSFTWFNSIDERNFPLGDVVLCQIAETENERISTSTRAAVCFLRGGTVNADIYPEAAVCFERGGKVITEIIVPGMTDFEKVKAIHDWMLEAGKKLKLPKDYNKRSELEIYNIIKTAYGFMSGFGGDCMGWSDTFYMLCSMAGVSCSPVSACAEAGGATSESFSADHRFNVASLDGKIYYFDVFWDGGGSAYSLPPYTYFCMTSEQAARSHTWASPAVFGPPVATDTTYQVNAKTGALLNP